MDSDRLFARNVRALLAARRRERLPASGLRGQRRVYLPACGHLTFWIVLGGRFDPRYQILTMAVSLEAIFLSTFVLITQNRMTQAADRRADLALQINYVAEHEITRVLALVRQGAARVGVPVESDPELQSLMKDVSPEYRCCGRLGGRPGSIYRCDVILS